MQESDVARLLEQVIRDHKIYPINLKILKADGQKLMVRFNGSNELFELTVKKVQPKEQPRVDSQNKTDDNKSMGITAFIRAMSALERYSDVPDGVWIFERLSEGYPFTMSYDELVVELFGIFEDSLLRERMALGDNKTRVTENGHIEYLAEIVLRFENLLSQEKAKRIWNETIPEYRLNILKDKPTNLYNLYGGLVNWLIVQARMFGDNRQRELYANYKKKVLR